MMTESLSSVWAAQNHNRTMESFQVLVTCTCLVATYIVIRTIIVFWEIYQARKHDTALPWHRRRNKGSSALNEQGVVKLKTLVVLGSGGHTTEMLQLLSGLNDNNNDTTSSSSKVVYDFVYCKAASDTTSLQRVETFQKSVVKKQQTKRKNSAASDVSKSSKPEDIVCFNIPRAREVGQSYLTSIPTTMYAQLYALYLVLFQIQPHLVLCNGPGTCWPICLAALLFRILYLPQRQRQQQRYCHIVFCESLCRVKTLSLTGKLLYYITDVFLVHWKELHQQYPKYTRRIQTFVKDE